MSNDFDFSGYATKHGIKCSDGRTITADAFKHCDGIKVPLVWQHQHNEPGNILGSVTLENRPDGVYAYGKFNDNETSKVAKSLVQHGDITSLSIYANKLVEKAKQVLHGNIREVSLVLSGANPGALIDNVVIAHGDSSYIPVDDEAVIYSGEALAHSDHDEEDSVDEDELDLEHADTDTDTEGDETVQDVFDTLTDKQKNVVYYMIGQALDEGDDDDDDSDDDVEHSDYYDSEEYLMHKNIFEGDATPDQTLSHSDIEEIISDAKRNGSLKEAFLAHAGTYGIENIDLLFPDAQTLNSTPDFISRRMDWVSDVLTSTRHTPFSRIKTIHADITEPEARARGYIKGNLKKEEVFKLLKRVTTPTTIYKKQKLDRDDMIDITDFDVVAWLKAEMRMMLDEEIARAVLVGDGRSPDDEDKINEDCIRPIAFDDALYAPKYIMDDADPVKMIEFILRARKDYEGTGNPNLYLTTPMLMDLLLAKDTTGRRFYDTDVALANALRVNKIVEVPVMEGVEAEFTEPANGSTMTLPVACILVNPADYVIGADKGGAIGMFDDFDIDYNQYKYLIETRCSGALVKPKSALVFGAALPELLPKKKATPAAPVQNN